MSLSHIKVSNWFLEQKQYSYCLVLVGSKNGFESDLTLLNCLFCNQTKTNWYKLHKNSQIRLDEILSKSLF